MMKGHADIEGYMKGHHEGGGAEGGGCIDEQSIGSPCLTIPPEDITERIPVSAWAGKIQRERLER